MDIWQEALAVEDYVIRCRRYLHENPELSDLEDGTVAFILKELTAMGIDCVDVPGGGVMGFIHGGKPGKSVLLRADIDALPVQEDPCNLKQPKVCVSKVPGVAHMCGHDAHTAMLLGACKILQEHRCELPGEIVLYFERGEEAGHGDYYMNKYLQDHHIHVDSAWAQHVRASIPAGQVSVISGGAYAGTAGLGATILGENALACGVAVINGLNTARMRDMDPYERVTLSVNKLQYRDGVCQISGTCRYYDFDKAGVPMRKAIERIITETVDAYGCTTKNPVRSRAGNRAVMNHPVCCRIIRNALTPLIGAENVIETDPTMGAESFSVLSAYYPSVMVLTGVGNPEKGMNAGLHSPQFEPDEAGFKIGVAAAVAYAQAFLAYDKPIEFHGFVGSIDEYLNSGKG